MTDNAPAGPPPANEPRAAAAAPRATSASARPAGTASLPSSTGSIPITTGSIPITGSNKIIVDPSRRADVLFRVRRDDDHEVSAWWLIGAFVAVSAAVIVLLSFVPGGS